MAKQESENSRYESKFGGGFVSPAQFIAEIMCSRMAKKDGYDLPMQFWKLPAWKKNFMSQVLAANATLKLYSVKAILTALRKVPNAYSLRARWLVDVMEKEQIQYETVEAKIEAKIKEEVVPAPSPAKPPEAPRPSFTPKKTTLGKLRKLDE